MKNKVFALKLYDFFIINFFGGTLFGGFSVYMDKFINFQEIA